MTQVTSRRFLALLALLVALGPGAAAQNGGTGQGSASKTLTRRFALVSGSNAGAAGEVRLRYAASDAKRFAAVLNELGGVAKDDLIILVDPSLSLVKESFGRLRRSIAESAKAGARNEFVLYYSGHSDDSGLHLGPESFPYEALKAEIEKMGADVKVAIVDSCSSGSFTRAKGGTSKPAFLFDASSDMEGHAYLTSSSEDEAAQESDKLGGSFFTYYFVSGLRGAADLDGRGLVTLNEAYAYAFKETLASTEGTRYGPQHPAYDIHLTGTGDLVFTDLRSKAAGLALAEGLSGRIFVRDSKGALAVELDKVEGKRMELGLEAGRYEVVMEKGTDKYRASVTISQGARTSLAPGDFQWFNPDATTARGSQGAEAGHPGTTNATANAPTASATGPSAETSAASYNSPPPDLAQALAGLDPRKAPATIFLSLLPSIKAGLFSSGMDRNLSINAIAGNSASIDGIEISSLWNTDSRDLRGFQAAGLGNFVAGDVTAFQVAGLANYAGREVHYAQLAGLANIAGGGLSGAQIAGLANFGGLWDGRAGGIETRRSAKGLQLAGGFNAAANGFRGAQISGGVNWAEDLGAGVQLAGVLNRADAIVGAQVGTVNLSGAVQGAQVGLVNVTGTVKGLQLGLVNIADKVEGLSLGLLCFERGGIQTVEVLWDSVNSLASLDFKLGTRHSYSLITSSVSVLDASVWSFGAGYGGRITLGPFFLDLDLASRVSLSSTTTWTDYASLSPSLEGRALVGLKLGRSAIVLGGVLDYDLYGASGAEAFTTRYLAGIQF